MLTPPENLSNTEEAENISSYKVLEKSIDVQHDASSSEFNTEGNSNTTLSNPGALETNLRQLHLNNRQRESFAGLPFFSYGDLVVALNGYTEVIRNHESVIDYSALSNAWDYAIYYGSKV